MWKKESSRHSMQIKKCFSALPPPQLWTMDSRWWVVGRGGRWWPMVADGIEWWTPGNLPIVSSRSVDGGRGGWLTVDGERREVDGGLRQ